MVNHLPLKMVDSNHSTNGIKTTTNTYTDICGCKQLQWEAQLISILLICGKMHVGFSSCMSACVCNYICGSVCVCVLSVPVCVTTYEALCVCAIRACVCNYI